MNFSLRKYLFHLLSLMLIAATTLSVADSGIVAASPADPDLVYCPLTKKYQPRTPPVKNEIDPLDEICASSGTIARFNSDLVLSGKSDISSVERVKLFFQYSESGRSAMVRFVRSLHGGQNEEAPFSISFGKASMAGNHSGKGHSFLASAYVELSEPVAARISRTCPRYSQAPVHISNLKYGNFRPRSPPLFS